MARKKGKRGLSGTALPTDSKLRTAYLHARAFQAEIWNGWRRLARKLANEYRRTGKASHLEAFRNHCAEMRAWRRSRSRRQFIVQQVRAALAIEKKGVV